MDALARASEADLAEGAGPPDPDMLAAALVDPEQGGRPAPGPDGGHGDDTGRTT